MFSSSSPYLPFKGSGDDKYHKPGKRWRGLNNMMILVIAVLAFGVFLTIVNIYELRHMQLDHAALLNSPVVEGMGDHGDHRGRPVVWIHGKRLETGYLRHVFNVFERLGYSTSGTRETRWDVLWSHDYPFMELQKYLKLKPHQKVNHFPGSGYITNKVTLATSDIKFIPRAFKMPRDRDKFHAYSKKNPLTQWVQKSSNHRGVHIKRMSELDLTAENTFIQEYVDNPFLVDGRRFDIGIYTTLTSIDPLRVYIFDGEWLIRYCPAQYYPFDPSNVDKYVIGDDYVPTWKMASLKKTYTELGYTHKETLLAFIKKRGKNGEKLKQDLKAAIRGVYLNKEPNLISSASRYKSTRNFFEMVRFDFVLDKNLNIYLMEVNMSPNLSSGHFPGNKLMYEQVVYNLFSLVGVARKTTRSFIHSGEDEGNMQVADKDLAIYSDVCTSHKCEDNCLAQECKLCLGCLTVDQKEVLKTSTLEHLERRNWRRVFPTPFQTQDKAKKWIRSMDEEYQSLTPKNQFITLWFHGKCLQDVSWCT